MYVIIQNWKLVSVSNAKHMQDWVEAIWLDLSNNDIKKLQNWCLYKDWKIIETKEYKQKMLEEWIQKINEWFNKTIKDYIKDYPEMEVETWETKRIEAEKVLAWQASEYLNKLAEAKGVDIKELAQKIKEKADTYADMYTKLEAEKDKKIEELREQLK